MIVYVEYFYFVYKTKTSVDAYSVVEQPFFFNYSRTYPTFALDEIVVVKEEKNA